MPRIDTYTENTSIEDNDKLLTYDPNSSSTKLTPFSRIWSWIVSKLHALTSSSAALTPSTDRILMDKNGTMTRVEPAAVAKYNVETYNGSTIAGSAQTVKSALDTLNSKMPWTRLCEITQEANTSLDEEITVNNMSNAREIMFTIQRISNGRTFASSVVPQAQFSSGAIYAFGSYVLLAGPIKDAPMVGINAVCIWKTATKVEIAASANEDALKYRLWMR